MSGTNSTKKKNEKVSGTKTTNEIFSPVQNSGFIHMNVSTTHENGTDFPRQNQQKKLNPQSNMHK